MLFIADTISTILLMSFEIYEKRSRFYAAGLSLIFYTAVCLFKEQFQPSYDYTILLGTPFDYEVEDEPRYEPSVLSSESNIASTSSSSISVIQASSIANLSISFPENSTSLSGYVPTLPSSTSAHQNRQVSISPTFSSSSSVSRTRKRTRSTNRVDESYSSRETSVEVDMKQRLRASCSPSEMAEWLRVHRFNNYLHIFTGFDGLFYICSEGDDFLSLTGLSQVLKFLR